MKNVKSLSEFNFTSKADIQAALKKVGLGSITWTVDSGGRYDGGRSEKKIPYIGSSTKAIIGGNFGPMTVTDAYKKRNDEVEKKVTEALSGLGKNTEKNTYEFMISPRMKRTLFFYWETYPTYSPSMDYDDGYQTCWFVMNVKDEPYSREEETRFGY